MHLLESSGNKLSSIPRPIPTSGATTNQTNSLSIGPNNANVGGSDRKNAVTVDSAIGNKGIEELNEDAKVDSEI